MHFCSLPRTILGCMSLAVLCGVLRAQDYAPDPRPLLVDGTVTDGENKLADAEVVLFKGNEQVAVVRTGRNGRFGLKLELQERYALEFRHEGFIAKRIAIDSHMPRPRDGEEFELQPLDMSISLLERARYGEAPTDDLDFPFALVKYNKSTKMFEQDLEYTMGMQRVNGALLLMAARQDKK